MRKHFVLLFNVVMFFCLFAVFGVNSVAAADQVLVVRVSADPRTLNPNTLADDIDYVISQNIYNRLVKLDAEKKIIPDLARGWEVANDGMSITFHLNEGVLWHDGKPFTSKDVKYTFDTIAQNDTYVGHAFMVNVEDIATPDDITVVFNMKRPDVSLISYLGWTNCFVLPEHVFNNGQLWEDNPASMAPLGTGPFIFESYEPGVSVTAVKNTKYFQNEVKLDKVIFSVIPDNITATQALINGEIDILETVPDSEIENLRANGVVLKENEWPSPVYWVFNFMPGNYTTDYPIRKAIAHCINREDIVNKVFNGVRSPEYHFYPSMIKWASNPNTPALAFDIEAASAALEEAGYTKDSDGYYVRGIEVLVMSEGGWPDIAKLIQANCKLAGIEIIITPLEYQAWANTVWDNLNVEGGNFKCSLMSGFQGPDPALLQQRIGSGASNNLGQYGNKEIDELFLKALATGDQEARRPLYYRIQEIMSQELPIIPIVNYACFDGQGANVRMAPIECANITGWQEYSHTYLEN